MILVLKQKKTTKGAVKDSGQKTGNQRAKQTITINQKSKFSQIRKLQNAR